MDMMKKRCREVYSPGINLRIDESLVLFKGRLSFLQYIKTKRARFGIKLFQLCTSNGIPLDFIMYHGNIAPTLIEMQEGSLITERIPATLMQNYLNKGHHLFIDNYYTSIPLVEYFSRNGTYVTGTIRENRKQFPGDLKQVVLEKGEAAFYQHADKIITKYRGVKDSSSKKPKFVYVLSTTNGTSDGVTNRRDRDGNIIRKPKSIISYNHNMGGVDLVDLQLDSLNVLRKSYKWYKKIFIRLMMQCALAAHKLYKMEGGKEDLVYFLLDVCTHLFLSAPKLSQPRKPPTDNIIRLTGRNHWPTK